MTPQEILDAYKTGTLSTAQVKEELRNFERQVSRFHLSEGQKGLWTLQKISPDMSAYNIPICFRIGKKTDMDTFKRACSFVLEQYPILTTRIGQEDGVPYQEVPGFAAPDVRQKDISDLASGEIIAYLKEKAKEPFSLENEPLMRMYLFSRTQNTPGVERSESPGVLPEEQTPGDLSDTRGCDYIVLIIIHHIIFDGVSLLPFLTTLFDAYQAFVKGRTPAVNALPANYHDFVLWEQRMLTGQEGKQHLTYWTQQLSAPLPVLELPVDRPRLDSQSFKGQTYTYRLTPELSDAIRSLAASQKVNPAVVFLGIYTLLLYRYTGQEDIIVGIPSIGRHQERFDDVIGYFINMLPVRSQIAPGESFSQFLETLQVRVADALDHSAYPFAAIVRELHLARTASHAPVFQVAFSYQNFLGSMLETLQAQYRDTYELEFVEEIHQEGEYELELEVSTQQEHFALHLKYNPDVFEPAAITRMMGHYIELSQKIVKNPESALRDYAFLSAEEEKVILLDWNMTQTDYPDNTCMHELFERQAQKTPEAIAAVHEGESLSYRELDRKSGCLAMYLQHLGVRPDCPVGICMRRSLDMLVGLLGILKAGGAYLPLDPEYPVERLKYMLQDSHCPILLTQSDLSANILAKSQSLGDPDPTLNVADLRRNPPPNPLFWKERGNSSSPSLPKRGGRGVSSLLNDSGVNLVFLDQNWEKIEQAAQQDVQLKKGAQAQHLAYLMYTSGSTGQPKGVMIPQRALTNFLLTMGQRPGLTSSDRLLAITTVSFDIAGLELFLPLIKGAQCIYATVQP